MALNLHPRDSAAASDTQNDAGAGLYSGWSEHLVSVVAAGIAILIVAAIAVLMGMA